MRVQFLALLALLSAPASAIAAQDDAVLACSAIENGLKRLDCFDAIAADRQAQADKSVQPIANTDTSTAWTASVSKSPIDDSTTVFLWVTATERYYDDYTSHQPVLYVRCKENRTVLYIDFDGDYMSDIAGHDQVTTRLDKAAAHDYSMDVSTDNHALGLWNGGRSIPLIKQMLGAKTMLVRATPVSANPVTLDFNIAGLDNVITPLREACHW